MVAVQIKTVEMLLISLGVFVSLTEMASLVNIVGIIMAMAKNVET